MTRSASPEPHCDLKPAVSWASLGKLHNLSASVSSFIKWCTLHQVIVLSESIYVKDLELGLTQTGLPFQSQAYLWAWKSYGRFGDCWKGLWQLWKPWLGHQIKFRSLRFLTSSISATLAPKSKITLVLLSTYWLRNHTETSTNLLPLLDTHFIISNSCVHLKSH